MAYTIKQARPVLLNYLGLTEENANYIENTDKWGIKYEKNDLKCVIFMMPLGENTSSPKIYFDVRDSGAEKFVAAWEYAESNDLKFFCLGVKDENEIYKNSVISVEADIKTVLKVSGLENGRRSGSGTQLNIPKRLVPNGNITRTKSDKFDIFFAAIDKSFLLTYLEIFDNRLFQYIYNSNNLVSTAVNIDCIPFPPNRIIFGAPGTGKSHKLNDESSLFETNKERVTFHPNYSYAQFVGTYKPVKKNNTDTRKEEIFYEYVPGPFMRTFVKAYFDSKKYISNCNALIENAKKENTNVKYYIAPCNISDWNYFEKINHINQIESWRNPPNDIKEGDVIFIYIGTTGLREFNDSRKPGVYAIATALSKPYEASGVRARVDLKFIDIALKNPLYTEDEIKEKNPNNRIQNFQEFSFGKNLLRDNDSTLKKFKPLNFLLLIEEINRANVAAVFGDVFQLLDRDENGNSEYPIAASEDIKKYLAKNDIDEEELKIPSNMYIWATMNSADQGVFPMDTAFKRRWEFEYIGIDENEDKVNNYEIPISATKKVNWNELRKAINNKLISLGINEDKLLGPFFLSKTVLDSALDKGMDFVKLFESKVLMYLFEDAAKMKAKQLFNVAEKKFIYSEVCKKFELEGLKVFKFNEEDVVKEHDIPSKKDDTPSDGQLF